MTSPYTYQIDANPASLQTEIEAGSYSASLVGIRTSEVTVGGDRDVEVLTSPDLTAGEETELTDIINAHTP